MYTHNLKNVIVCIPLRRPEFFGENFDGLPCLVLTFAALLPSGLWKDFSFFTKLPWCEITFTIFRLYAPMPNLNTNLKTVKTQSIWIEGLYDRSYLSIMKTLSKKQGSDFLDDLSGNLEKLWERNWRNTRVILSNKKGTQLELEDLNMPALKEDMINSYLSYKNVKTAALLNIPDVD